MKLPFPIQVNITININRAAPALARPARPAHWHWRNRAPLQTVRRPARPRTDGFRFVLPLFRAFRRP